MPVPTRTTPSSMEVISDATVVLTTRCGDGRANKCSFPLGVDIPVDEPRRDVHAAICDRVISGQHLDGGDGQALADRDGGNGRPRPLRCRWHQSRRFAREPDTSRFADAERVDELDQALACPAAELFRSCRCLKNGQ